MMVKTSALLGVLLAGGESSRFGSHKALSVLGGRPMGEWGLAALGGRFPQVVALANDPAVTRALGVPARPDLQPGMGPLGGLVTALEWAREEGWGGVFLLACDLPLVGSTEIGGILDHGFRGKDILLPESLGPLGVEPLCGAYKVACLDGARGLLAQGRRSMKGLLDLSGYTEVSMPHLGGRERVSRVFLNINTREDAERAAAFLVPDGGDASPDATDAREEDGR